MQMLYNSENFAVVRIDVQPGDVAPGSGDVQLPWRGGFEIVDKFARKGIFLEGALAESFRQGVDALIKTEPTGDEIDAYLERFASLMQQPLSFH